MDKLEKSGLIHHTLNVLRHIEERPRKGSLWEGLAAYQVVGEVMAHQAEDGYPV